MQEFTKKIAILHDAFLYRGGGERLVTLMAKSLNAELVSGFFSGGSFDPRELGFAGKIISLGKPVFAKGIRHIVLFTRFFSQAKILSNYDVVIFSGNCLDALRHVRPDAIVYYYCHTPPRYIFDFRERYFGNIPSFLKKILYYFLDIQASSYKSKLSRFDLIFTNSQNVHDRLLHYTGYESTILYPPTDVARFQPSNLPTIQSSYYLSFARLSPPKRVDLIVEAFTLMPEKKLIFTYGKNDPQKELILKKIRAYPNIQAIEAPEEEELISLIQGAIATIYIPVDEDFGMSPVESMACGTPVIGVNDGGLRETIIDDETGLLLPRDITVQDIDNAVQKMTQQFAHSLQENCVKRAGEFSLEKFTSNLRNYLSL
ncbi:glycosyltransferase [Candidatus Gracilibacteria bacterium]|nr:glycosyltransferase [Candidatus Gracilibacteria bacterium]